MCGICGIVNHNRAFPVDFAAMKAMCDKIYHRGPDDEGYYTHGQVGMGMRRLAIIDLSGGSQPIYNEDGSIAIVFNGEIYNYLELKKTLEQRGHLFKTASDTEVIVHGYEEWGQDCPKKLRGMFVFAIYDSRQDLLMIARDRMGKKPLYYYQDQQRFLFASEIKAMFACEGVPAYLNEAALDVYLSLGYVPAPQTLFAGIYKLPAGHFLTLKDDQISVQEYWDLQYEQNQSVSLEMAARTLKDLLWDAVQVRLMSEVPLGAYLSGGIDSSLLIGIMSQLMSKPVETFSMGFEGKDFDELPYARTASKAFGTHHHEIMLDTCSPEMLEKIVWHLDEPVADPAAVPTLLLSELARQHVTVVLTGEGGDELFGGYNHYRQSLWARQSQIFKHDPINRAVLPWLAKGYNRLTGHDRYHPRTLWYWSLPESKRMGAWVAIFTGDEKRLLYGADSEWGRQSVEYDARGLEVFGVYYDRARAKDMLHRMMYTDSKVWLPEDLLMKVDKMSMAHSIEARAPYLDHLVVEYVASLGAHVKINHNTPKYLLKQVARHLLPAEIIDRPKHTFDVPIGQWLNGSLSELTRQMVESGIIAGRRYFDPRYTSRTLMDQLQTHQPGAARKIWTLLNLGLWAQQYHVSAK